MGTLLRPAGPLPPKVYWVRRLVLVGVLLLVVALVAVAVKAWTRDDATPGTKPGSAAGATTAPADGADPGGEQPGGEQAPGDVPACAKDDVGVALSADGETFRERDVTFALEVKNTSDHSCLIDITDASRELVIVSGPARVWSSADCVDPEPRMLLLTAGQADTASLTWKRVRSEPGCPTKDVEAKPGTYRATVSVLGRTSEELVLLLS